MSATPDIILGYLQAMNKHNASDLYITVGRPPMLRGEKGFMPTSDQALTPEDITEILNTILTNRQRREFEASLELNSALDIGEHGRFRINVMRQRQHPALVIRRIISEIPNFSELKLPKIFEQLSLEKRGLILLTGITGSGKSTSLASMIDYRNTHEEGHIITVEDPIEYFHDHKKSVITQREVGVDTESYATALNNALRQRPDVILVGEIRDREVMTQALTIAETGHLCLATIHTSNSYQAIERIVNLFPEDLSGQVRLNLSMNLKAIVSQRLLPDIRGNLIPAVEVMLNQGLIRDLILKGDIGKIKGVMEQNNSNGMCSYDQSLLDLFMQDQISEEVAINYADKASDIKVKIHQAKLARQDKTKTESVLSSLDTSVISFRD